MDLSYVISLSTAFDTSNLSLRFTTAFHVIEYNVCDDL